jgi:Dolichyl-phosphate-mannose-protein mannosyltransferase
MSVAILLLVQLVLLGIVFPVGNFPLNDDWAYAHSVLWLLDEHRLRLSNWIAMNLLPQTLLGAAAAKLFGFSFTGLRVVTQLLAMLTSLVAFSFYRTSGLSRSASLVATLILLATPWWQVLANTYMTDLYGLLFGLLAATYFLRHLAEPKPIFLLLAVLFTVVGVLQRQVVLVIPLAFMCAWYARLTIWRRGSVIQGVLPLAIAFAAEVAYQAYLEGGPGIPAAQQVIHGRLFPMLIGVLTLKTESVLWFFLNLAGLVGYLGLVVTPWVSWLGGTIRAAGLLRWLALGGLCLFGISVAWDWMPPYRQNHVIDLAGIGPFTVHGGFDRNAAGLDRSTGIFWLSMAFLAAAGTAAMLAAALRTPGALVREFRERAGSSLFHVCVILAYLVPFAVTDYIDRYVLFVLPFVLVWMHSVFFADAVPPGRLARAVTVVLLSCYGVMSAVATHDYFAWNRARWEAIAFATRQLGANPRTLDGGFEYNGFFNFERMRLSGSRPGKSPWWVEDDRYQVAFSGRVGYQTVKTFAVDSWLSRTPAKILLLQRAEAAGAHDTDG